MPSMQILVAYLATAVSFLVIDTMWIKNFVVPEYKRDVGDMLAESPSIPAAIAFYLIYIAGIVIFGIIPGKTVDAWQVSGILGALFGGIAYATYALTNKAVLRDWSWRLVYTDIAWGVVATGVAAVLGHLAVTAVFG